MRRRAAHRLLESRTKAVKTEQERQKDRLIYLSCFFCEMSKII
jgi:hypothetical protein